LNKLSPVNVTDLLPKISSTTKSQARPKSAETHNNSDGDPTSRITLSDRALSNASCFDQLSSCPGDIVNRTGDVPRYQESVRGDEGDGTLGGDDHDEVSAP
jgi:hypothetical protein